MDIVGQVNYFAKTKSEGNNRRCSDYLPQQMVTAPANPSPKQAVNKSNSVMQTDTFIPTKLIDYQTDNNRLLFVRTNAGGGGGEQTPQIPGSNHPSEGVGSMFLVVGLCDLCYLSCH